MPGPKVSAELRTRFERVRDAVIVAAALAFAAVTLSYPFGRDQSLFAYVGREWFLRGRMPYRDVIEHKPPLIYFVHGVLASLFGTRMWPSRLLEIGLVVLVAKLATIAGARLGERPRSGTFAATVFLLITFHFGWLTFWDTGNTEIWVVLFVVGALAALRMASPTRAAYACGMALGFAFVAKPPAAWFFPIVLLVAAGRYQGWRGRAGALLRMLAAAAVLPALVCLYFGAKGDLWFLFDVVVRASGHVATRERSVDTLADVARVTGETLSWYGPYTAVAVALVIALVVALASGRRRWVQRYGVVPLAILAAYGAVAMQLRFFLYHYGLLAAAAALGFSLCADDLHDLARVRWKRWVPVALSACAVVFLVIGGAGPRTYRQRAGAALAFARGTMTSAQLDATFDIEGYFANTESHHVAEWLKAHSEPTDNVVVRGYEPQIYALSDRFFNGRFFWTTFLTHPARAYRRESWLEQDRQQLEAQRPRYAVTFGVGQGEIDSAFHFEALGYVREVTFGPFIILRDTSRRTLPDHCATALGDRDVTLRDGFYDAHYEHTSTPLRWSGERATIVVRPEAGRPARVRIEGSSVFEPKSRGTVTFAVGGGVATTNQADPGLMLVVLDVPPAASPEAVIEIRAQPARPLADDPRPHGFLVTRVCWD